MCAGQGRDVIPVLRDHPRGREVDAVLLELDPANVAVARDAANGAGLTRLEVVETDAAISDPYGAYVPADIILACGIFGNITDRDLEGTVRHLSMLCAPRASIIWTRHWKEPALIAGVRQWFVESGFEDLGFDALENERKVVIGVARLQAPPLPFQPHHRFFTFVR
ncbi:MAG TPA: class I SAM-dependent methyltransferase [Candidatus Dormibacteraeota bacterium]|nr:class I SAM-dependent methyltransferase [Candidatus Dormibacteraeota bacterium]